MSQEIHIGIDHWHDRSPCCWCWWSPCCWCWWSSASSACSVNWAHGVNKCVCPICIRCTKQLHSSFQLGCFTKSNIFFTSIFSTTWGKIQSNYFNKVLYSLVLRTYCMLLQHTSDSDHGEDDPDSQDQLTCRSFSDDMLKTLIRMFVPVSKSFKTARTKLQKDEVCFFSVMFLWHML